MYAKEGSTVSLESFNSLTGILSVPVDLDEFNFSSSLIKYNCAINSRKFKYSRSFMRNVTFKTLATYACYLV